MILGLNPIDVVVVLVCLAATLGVGVWASRGIKQEGDFYLGGRKMGRVLQFFLSFGNASDPTGAGQTASEVYRQGAGGVWMSLQVLFITPFFWFTQVWFRRARTITMADLFVDRFNSRAIASMYAGFNICIALLWLGAGNLAVYKVVSAMVVKQESAYTQSDQVEIARFHDYEALKQLKTHAMLSDDETNRLEAMTSDIARDKLHSFITYVPRMPFYIIYSIIVASYVMLGGLRAAAVSDAIQGVLILLMSFIMVPLGLHYIGGFHKLHQSVAAVKFQLLGTSALSEYAWYTLLAIIFGSLIQILGLSHNMSIGGSARDESTARFGMISGGFAKRFVIIAWMFCGLLALGILTKDFALSDPNNAWGSLSKILLTPIPGLVGLMMTGMLLGHMPFVATQTVSVSGLITRNIYEPLFPGRDEKHYLRVGQWMIPAILALTILVSLLAGDEVVQRYAKIITFNIFFGAVVFLIFFWRRLTPTAIILSFIIWVVLFGIIPYTVPQFPSLRQSATLTMQTESVEVTDTRGATTEDVAAGKARAVGDPVAFKRKTDPKPCFFEKLALVENSKTQYEGLGQFYPESFAIYCLGVPIQKFPPAAIVAERWAFDGVFPFLMLIVFSLLTKQKSRGSFDDFYVRMKTPIIADPEEDRRQLAANRADPARMERLKLFPDTYWEFQKWTWQDFVGFLGCWAIVGLIVAFLWLVVTIGS